MAVIVLVGRMASGKTTLKNEILKESPKIKPIITYTTRPMRDGEEDGVDYHFISNDTFNAMKRRKEFLETTEYNADFGYCQYGSRKEDYYGPGLKVVVLNPFGAKAVREDPKIESRIIWLDPDEEVLMKRALERGDKPEEINRRFITDESDFLKFKYWGIWDIHYTDNSTKRCLKYIKDSLVW